MSVTQIRALDSSNTLILSITASTGITLRALTAPGVQYRTREVEFDDVPSRMVIQSVKDSQTFGFEVGASGATFGAAIAALETVTDAVCDPDLRTWKLEVTYDSGRVEKWTCLRPCDSSSRDYKDSIAHWVVASFTVPVNPDPVVT